MKLLDVVRCIHCGGSGRIRHSNVGSAVDGEPEICDICGGTGATFSRRKRPDFGGVCLTAMFVITIITFVSPELGAALVLILAALTSWGMWMRTRV